MTLGLLKVVGANATTAFLKVHHDQTQDPPGNRSSVVRRRRLLCASAGDTEGTRDRYSCDRHGPGRCDGNRKETRRQKTCGEESSQSRRRQKGHAGCCREISGA